MKLFRYKTEEGNKTGVSINDAHYDVSSHISEYDRDFFDADGIAKLKEIVANGGLSKLDEPLDFDAPLYRPEKIICIGLNYSKHAAESGMEPPKEPVVFFKSPSSLTGPFDNIIIPKNSTKTDWEVELAVIIGKKANYVSEEEAMDYVAGYAVHNDVSEREFQLERGGQWVKGKSCDSFAPLGPYLVTKDEVADPHNLNLWLKLNGKKVQDGNTSDFIFNIPQVISHLSQFMSLMPGDVISTGTPEGVGLGFKPPVYLKPGDEVELGIEGLGTAKQKVVAHS
ncbi:2-keto-4-pentenoate hydratase/2-oxohepta-3-ene-1,7-dioic acid hydratase in catechol pathway [Roseivirga pacifica]|uniref:2-keto-4-pentenoate hydratase/2-oxohepta-3-ene-1,7-dioic acid hydratase (Catechol pathway) n=1 Tax=Roseivirga pacifica TaxID=1267423 RepID=A0A1I0Q1X9_9BACT|nr:fumarylacetoacetate hydrolase family protein [Roseivirga pacifica]RKQ43321.1 2-keto-4-pentenoate hydratase/2-oxohepta-3-ene-1,7-dioic acid hydratase in catechol pathway [Roseivirga pacifica]SEW20924.1 2-keto-4-pentenoate hydratase/2-oxohepta-3-ene-1,7-dioic acid hydratase (catechol pathway) [Roseivirga pacifica]